jgi:uncharacterized OB-fold protein
MTIRTSRVMGEAGLLPKLDPLNHEWFTRGVITIQRCSDCQAFQHPPDEICGTCQGDRLQWRECEGGGHIESVAVVHQAVHPAFKASVPYALVVVSLDDAPGVNVIGNVVDRRPQDVEIGQRVRAVFEQVDATDDCERLLIPVWEVV